MWCGALFIETGLFSSLALHHGSPPAMATPLRYPLLVQTDHSHITRTSSTCAAARSFRHKPEIQFSLLNSFGDLDQAGESTTGHELTPSPGSQTSFLTTFPADTPGGGSARHHRRYFSSSLTLMFSFSEEKRVWKHAVSKQL